MPLIKTLKDKLGNIIYPQTKEKCIYDENNIRLDNKINNDLIKVMIEYAAGISIESYVNSLGYDTSNYKTPSKTVRIYAVTDFPSGYGYGADNDFIFTIFKIDNNLWRAIAHDVRSANVFLITKIAGGAITWNKMIVKSDIINTDTVNDTSKVPSSAVTYALGQEIDILNNNLATKTGTLTPISGYTVETVLIKQSGNVVSVYGVCRKTDSSVLGTAQFQLGIISGVSKPSTYLRKIVGFGTTIIDVGTIAGYGYMGTGGDLYFSTSNATAKYVSFEFNYIV